jgi:hypothetical protein
MSKVMSKKNEDKTNKVGNGEINVESLPVKDEISVAPVSAHQFETDMNNGVEIRDGTMVDSDGKELPVHGDNDDHTSHPLDDHTSHPLDDHTSHPKEVYYDDADEQTMKHKHRFREKCVIDLDL